MTFAEVDRQYLELKRQFHANELSEAEFDEALMSMMIQDAQGRWWAKARDSGQWNYYDGATQRWTPASPPSATPPAAPPPMMSPLAEPDLSPRAYTQPALQPSGATAFSASQPELSPGLKVVFYILSFLVPIVGIVLFFVYRGKPTPQDQAAARLFLILGIISFGLSCLCGFLFPLMWFTISS
ncbi:hypothetical protein [Caldilinea sp.]|uniref:hypothetical protein n=1 Tax=Caldilinea sp. TaxID=2293560 RepID=UPI002CFEE85B|nr:hypothetical protein [Caldilinea sp.]HRA69082.1 hypothetical protein [Caldilinea sp.]